MNYWIASFFGILCNFHNFQEYNDSIKSVFTHLYGFLLILFYYFYNFIWFGYFFDLICNVCFMHSLVPAPLILFSLFILFPCRFSTKSLLNLYSKPSQNGSVLKHGWVFISFFFKFISFLFVLLWKITLIYTSLIFKNSH